jgi:16S rRNA (uracil1498-N3)-methyltransferase
MRTGQEIVLFNGVDGCDYRACLAQVDKKSVTAQVHARSEVEATPKLDIRLALGISRGERMDLALQKSVELGVTQITPLLTERTQIKLSPQRMEKRIKHWQGIIINACEQSGRRFLPKLDPATKLQPWLSNTEENLLFMDPESGISLAGIKSPTGNICFLIGPEGGFSDRERTLALTAGATPIRLGPRILRTETAPLAAIAAAQILWGDFL